MNEGLVPARPSSESVAPSFEQGFGGYDGTPVQAQNPLERPLAALRRYKWLIAAVVAVSAGLGVLGTKLITPQYQVRATLWIESEAPDISKSAGPIRGGELLRSGAWIELFKSFRVVDQVVRDLALYIQPENGADLPLFSAFGLADRFAPGTYELQLDQTAKTWILRGLAGAEIEHGAATDSVGRKVGFRWLLPGSAFDNGSQRVRFTVVTPREKSIQILDRLESRMAIGSNFLWLTYRGPDAKLAARTMNTWVEHFVAVASDLKRRNVAEYAKILDGQLKFAEKATQDAESAYQTFRINTIILPAEGGPVAARGSEGDTDPALISFFDQKIEYDNLRSDREALEKSIASAAAGTAPYEGLLFIPSVAQSPGAEALREAFRSQYQLQANLRVEKQTFTDQYPSVMQLTTSLDVLQKQTIPQLANQLLAQLKERERNYERRIQAASKELKEIPPRTIEERRLSRAVVVSEGLYTNLKTRYAEARLAEASATPDVSVLDTAIAPLGPTQNTASKILLLAIAGGLGLAAGLALLLEKLDGKLRYTEQATTELGLVIAGAVPRIPKSGIDPKSPEQVVQFVESFRTLRMHILHAGPGQRITLAVTSAAPGDGKSLISTNLALSFAEAGLRTVLIDGDTRRGSLHRMHNLSVAPGLTEYLDGRADEASIVRATSHANLSLISCGARHPRSPELLASQRLKRLVERMTQVFDVVIFDTPPLAAGIDGYAISAAAGKVLMVLRMGETERRLAARKLSMLDRLPVQVVGAVLNAVPQSGEFQYYTYSSGYHIDVDDPAGALTAANTR